MKWSRYSLLFESKRNGWLLFNSVSRAFLTVDNGILEKIQGIMADPEGYDYSDCPTLYMQLRSCGFIVEDEADDDFYNITKMRALSSLYSTNRLMLTIAITRACNFDCSYCFEGNRTGKPMSEEVEEKLIKFISNSGAKNLSITWYGGEPLLAFDRILSIDARLKKLGKPYSAAMITNGYLLTEEKIAKLNELKIGYLQITLDGKAETHDGRRYLKNKAPTYHTILSNIDKLMASDFKGTLHVRVNVDARNEHEFAYVYKMMQKRYPKDFGRRISVYPGFVKGDDHPDVSCFFEADRQGEFCARMYTEHGIVPLTLFPGKNPIGCTLTYRNSFVVGPDGELYKCWDDVGMEDSVVGHIDRFDNWNMPLIAKGMVASSYLDSQECRECFYFPICNGGCHRIRMKNLSITEGQHSPCSYFKGNLENLLELHYERKMIMQARQQAAKARQQAAQAQSQTVRSAENKNSNG